MVNGQCYAHVSLSVPRRPQRASTPWPPAPPLPTVCGIPAAAVEEGLRLSTGRAAGSRRRREFHGAMVVG
ncbi:MAG: hypothetical protein V8S34_04170 [Lawsonibacter sp.]